MSAYRARVLQEACSEDKRLWAIATLFPGDGLTACLCIDTAAMRRLYLRDDKFGEAVRRLIDAWLESSDAKKLVQDSGIAHEFVARAQSLRDFADDRGDDDALLTVIAGLLPGDTVVARPHLRDGLSGAIRDLFASWLESEYARELLLQSKLPRHNGVGVVTREIDS